MNCVREQFPQPCALSQCVSIEGLDETSPTGTARKLSILVLGMTGAGKSALVNTLVGSPIFPEGATRNSETCCIQACRFDLPWGYQLEIADSPGFEDNRAPAHEMAQQRALAKVTSGRHFDMCIWVISMADVRIKSWVKDKWKDYEQWFSNFWARTILVFTHAEQVINRAKDANFGEEAMKQHVLGDEGIMKVLHAPPTVPFVFTDAHCDNVNLRNGYPWLSRLWATLESAAPPIKRMLVPLFLQTIRGGVGPTRSLPQNRMRPALPGNEPELAKAFSNPNVLPVVSVHCQGNAPGEALQGALSAVGMATTRPEVAEYVRACCTALGNVNITHNPSDLSPDAVPTLIIRDDLRSRTPLPLELMQKRESALCLLAQLLCECKANLSDRTWTELEETCT